MLRYAIKQPLTCNTSSRVTVVSRHNNHRLFHSIPYLLDDNITIDNNSNTSDSIVTVLQSRYHLSDHFVTKCINTMRSSKLLNTINNNNEDDLVKEVIVKTHFGGVYTRPNYDDTCSTNRPSQLYTKQYRLHYDAWTGLYNVDEDDNEEQDDNEEDEPYDALHQMKSGLKKMTIEDVNNLEEILLGWMDEMHSLKVNPVVNYLCDNSHLFPNLKSIVVNDFLSDDCEVSWIPEMDVTCLMHKFQQILHFQYKGHGDILQAFTHEKLLSLCIISGGTRKSILQSLSQSQLPSLHHLEIWLGTEYYGCQIDSDDIRTFLDTIFTRNNMPNLRSLALKNYEHTDESIDVIMQSDLVKQRIIHLDISEGTLSDVGAKKLIMYMKNQKESDQQMFQHLKSIDCHHNYLTRSVEEELSSIAVDLQMDINLDGNEYEDGTQHRYVSVGE